MAKYIMEGFGISAGSSSPFIDVDRVNLVLNTSGASTFSYSYLGDQFIAPNFTGSFTLKYDGVNIGQNGYNIGFAQVSWGAGIKTQVAGLEFANGESFFAPVRGDRMPNLDKDKGHVAIEYFYMVDKTGSVSNVKAGPFKPNTDIKIRDFFLDDTSSPFKQGNNASERLTGGAKDNLIVAQKGNDKVFGKDGDDTLLLGRGNDTGYGGNGHDVISGYLGDDKIYGGSGQDKIYGFVGQDRLWGGKAKDKLYGGIDKDRLDGGKGDDKMWGGQGADVFVFSDGGDKDRIKDFAKGNDILKLNDNLWNGSKTAEQVVDQFASKGGGNITFDFGGGDILIVEDYLKLGEIKELIEII